MTRQHQIRLRMFALLAAAGTSVCSEEVPAQVEGLTVSYSLESSAITMHEPVVVRFEVVNESTQPITLRLGRDRKENFDFVIRRPDGSSQKRPPLPRREGVSVLPNVTLAPNERFRDTLVLNEWAFFPVPGEYALDARLLTQIETGSGAKIASEPYHTIFKIQPRDESRLITACEKLTRQIESASSVREALDAASALAYVDDPIVVPYLEKALQSGKYVEAPIMAALVRIGNEAAARILIAEIRASPAWPPNVDTRPGIRATLAKQALQKIAATTSNERLRGEIRQALP